MSMIGKSLAHYEITDQIGKGGMGEVYRAKDTKLGRDVAIKVLPEEFVLDPDRVARFQQEAKLLASLNHPNIAAIHGLEDSDGAHFLVMELIEGDTLADRIKKGPIPVEEALKLAIQIAEAVEAAHENGVIHRDLKPANIKVTPDGKVKVLDFGLAKAYVGDQENLNPLDSPTISAAATRQGVILGTAAYMSPEQARGKLVDRRTDIWAFGAVLYEMLTGKKAFSGDDVTDTLAAVIRSEPEWKSLPANLHWRLRELLERCLEKKERDRCSGISDARVDIQKVLVDPSGMFSQSLQTIESKKKLRLGFFWVLAAIALTAVIIGGAVWKLKPTPKQHVMRFDYDLPESQQFTTIELPVITVSPDGKQFVYATTEGLYLRSVHELKSKLIAGTEGTTAQPFFSPDGKSIGYFSLADRQLKKISIRGGAPVTLCTVGQFVVGASWGTDNTIVYGQYPAAPVMRISANGGTPEEIIQPGGPAPVLFPQILPDGGSILYTAYAGPTQGRIMVQSRKSGEPKELFAGMAARYLPTGHLVYQLPNNNNLYAVAFDLDKLEVKGGPVPIVEGVLQSAMSDAGTLVYIPGAASQTTSAGTPERTLVWVDRQGKEEVINLPPDHYLFPSISPDGKRIALTKRVGNDTANQHIWIWDLVRETMTPLTTGKSSANHKPIWTRDGKRIVYISYRDDGKFGIYWKAADGTGEDQVLVLSPAQTTMLIPWSWSSDGQILAMGTVDFTTNPAHGDIETLSMEGDHIIKVLLHAEYNQTHPSISPDGKYMAYMSGEVETGQPEIFVRPFPEVDKGKWPISTGGGESPLWSPDGRELFYRNEGAVMVVSIDTKTTFSAEKPRVLFQGPYVTGYEESPAWDISPGGKKFLMIKQPSSTNKPDSAAGPRKIIVVANWTEELKERVPVD